jgi:hypothetical protein
MCHVMHVVGHHPVERAKRARPCDQLLKLRQEVVLKYIWWHAWRAYLGVRLKHTLPLRAQSRRTGSGEGLERGWPPRHGIVCECCSRHECRISDISVELLKPEPSEAVWEVQEGSLRCLQFLVAKLADCFHRGDKLGFELL